MRFPRLLARGVAAAPGICAAAVALVSLSASAASARQTPAARGSLDASSPQSTGSASWQFTLTPYLWAAGLKGEVGVRGHTVDVDVGFSEIVENLDFALMLAGKARRRAWGAGFEVIYLDLSAHRATPGPLFEAARFEMSELMIELTGRYFFQPATPVTVDLFAGGRYWVLDSSIDLTGGLGPLPDVSASGSKDWFDPILGASAVWANADWLIQARADIGGFGVGSDLTWQLLGTGGYRFNERVSIEAGYRYVSVDYEDDGFTFDVGTSGPLVGVTIRF